MRAPVYCSSEAYRCFADQLVDLRSTSALVRAAVAVSMHALDDLDPHLVDRRVDELAERIRRRVRSDQPAAKLAHLHDVLFGEEGFAGNTRNYYSALNSYLPVVMETRRGLPITLSLIYKAVAEQVGLKVEGINLPGHFVVCVHDGRSWMVVDPFAGGTVLSAPEAMAQIAATTGSHVPVSTVTALRPATHRQWLSRMLRNLQWTFESDRFLVDRGAMDELESLLMNRWS